MSGDERPLRLLSLDGGGVRGLSSLLILQHLMRTINPAQPPKPCDYFDLIGGTSTGGLIAIMLGRLKMSIEECINAYVQISRDVFQPKKKKFDILGRVSDALKVRGRFDSEALKRGIQKIVVQAGEVREAKLKIEDQPNCRVFVCATRGEMGMHTALLRSYESKKVREVDCTIWEAGRATSAASSFFDPIKIGPFDESFVDGGTGCNNPVEKLFEEALNIWGQGARQRIQCIISIGTGQPTEKGFGSGMKEIASTLIHISTETEQTALRFANVHAPFLGSSPSTNKAYFRFNVLKGLEEVGLERYEDKARIAAATKTYLSGPDISSDIVTCAGVLSSQLQVKEAISQLRASKEIIEKYLRSLAFREMDARLHGIEPADKDTCGWIFETTQFRNWESRSDVSSHHGVLWIKGKPGAGKSILMKTIWLLLEVGNKDLLLAGYFFHGRGKNPLEKSLLGLLQSILYQLLNQDPGLCEEFLPIFLDKQKKHGESIPWHVGELKNFLLSSVRKWSSTPVLLLVDALDECLDEEVQLVVTFLESLARSAIEFDKTLNVCLASRHYPQIRMSRADELTVEAQSKHAQDIIEYVRHNLTFNDAEIEKEIFQKADHVFLWVELVIKMLNEAYNNGRIRAMKKVLRNVPSDLDNLYSELLSKGRDSNEIQESVLMLQWVLFAGEQLSPEGLYYAVLAGTDPDQLSALNREKETRETVQRYITSTSKGLIEIRAFGEEATFSEDSDESDKQTIEYRTQFIHESVKGFLLSVKGLQSFDPSLTQHLIGTSHDRLASCCLSYVMMRSLDFFERENSKIKDLGNLYPLLFYSADFILFHMETAEEEGVSQITVLQKLQKGSKAIRRLQNMSENIPSSQWKENAEVLHVAASRNYYEIARKVVHEIGTDVDVVGGTYGIAILAAAVEGNEKIVQLLLQHGADVNAKGEEYCTAIQAAAVEGHERIVQLCILHGADVNSKGGYYYTALHAAAIRGRESIVRILLEHRADVNALGNLRGTALFEAKMSGSSEAIINLLLQHGAEDRPPIELSSEEEIESENTDPEEIGPWESASN